MAVALGRSPATPQTFRDCPWWDPSAWHASSEHPAGLEPRGAKILERSFVNCLSPCSCFATGWHGCRSCGSCQQHKGFPAALGARGSVLPLQPRCVSSRLLVAGAVPWSDRGDKKGFALGVGSTVYLLWGCSAGLALRV